MHRRAMLREFASPTRPRAGRAPLNPGENSNGTFEEYVSGADKGEKMAVLCREFDISRKTGYKIF